MDVSRITVVPGIGKRLGSSSQQELACHRCEWLGVGLYGGDQSFLRPGAGLGRSSRQPPALSLAWSEDSNRPRKERRIPSHEKPRWPLVQTAFVGQRCPCPARHARVALLVRCHVAAQLLSCPPGRKQSVWCHFGHRRRPLRVSSTDAWFQGPFLGVINVRPRRDLSTFACPR